MKYVFFLFMLLLSLASGGQSILIIESQTYTNSDETWLGVNIPRSEPTLLTFRNNSISSLNLYGYMLQAGDEITAATNNNLDGAVITGNKFTWNGTDIKSITHGLFTGHNKNVIIKYNYLDHVPMGIVRKSTNNMINTSGGVAYNIVRSPNVGIVIKGMSGVCIYNNTLYQDRTTSQTGRGLIDVYTNADITPNSVSHGTKIFNNVFYTKYQTLSINVMDQESLTGLESDYNVFYCESGTPVFNAGGTVKTFAEWQAMGYDLHSVVINPEFTDLINFVPKNRLDYAKDLGSEWAEGLSLNARWGTTNPATTIQNGHWQAGAVIYPVPVENLPPLVQISSPAKSTSFIAPATISIDALVSDADGTITKVEFYSGPAKLGERISSPWSFTWKEVPEGNYSITAAATDNSGARSVSDPVIVVVEKATQAVNMLPSVTISTPTDNSTFEVPATISISSEASDPDGTITKVEYFNGSLKIGESLTPPYTFSFTFETEGTYEITATATDNLNALTRSEPVRISVILKRKYPEALYVYPNPNTGKFKVDTNTILNDNTDQAEIAILTFTGKTVYTELVSSEVVTSEIDVSSLPSGNYIVMLTSRDKILATSQFIKI